MLRRLKSEVQFKIPPKKEIYLYVNLSELQRELYKQILTKNLDLVNGVNKDKIQLLNILMQLKKVCNHPYLFPKIEAGPPFIEGEHIIENSMKLKILDCLLLKLRSEGSRVLIFSQMTTMLNILDDYCRFRDFSYRRIDGSTSTDDRDSRIEEFQSENSDIFIFLLSTRAGGLGINLHKANTVIIYDSDWNPQVDLQAIDRAHRIGQTKTVTIYRFVTEGTVEEKIIERAAKKLKIDNLIIQKGKNIQNRVSAIEMTNMIQYGADKLFAGKQNGNSQDQSILDILKYSENKTEEIFGQLKKLEDKISINNLSLSSDSKDIYQFDGEDFKKYKESTENNFVNISINLGQRERKVLNAALDPQFKVKEIRKPKIVTGWRAMPNVNGGYEHQFYPVEELDELDDKEKAWNEYLERVENEKVSDSEEPPEEFTPEDEERRMKLLKQGFNNWTKKDFARFTKALEIVGIKDYHGLSKFVKGKSIEEIEEFAKYFEKNINKLKGGYKYKARITRLERESSKVADNQVILNTIFTRIVEKSDIIFSTSKQTELKIPYNDRHSR